MPTIKGAARQIGERMAARGINKLFLATDGTKAEVEDIKRGAQQAGLQVGGIIVFLLNHPLIFRFSS